MVKYDIFIGRMCKSSTVKHRIFEKKGGNRQEDRINVILDTQQESQFEPDYHALIKK